MKDDKQVSDDRFIVKDSKGLSIIVFLILTAMFISAVYYDNFSADKERSNVRIAYLTIIPAIFFLVKAMSNKIIIEINYSGFYYNGSLLTNWENFISAHFTEEEKIGSFSDNFVLYIEYYKPGTGMDYISKIPLTNTQNKSEEAILEAIKKFSGKTYEAL
jgi:hypothetical protein